MSRRLCCHRLLPDTLRDVNADGRPESVVCWHHFDPLSVVVHRSGKIIFKKSKKVWIFPLFPNIYSRLIWQHYRNLGVGNDVMENGN